MIKLYVDSLGRKIDETSIDLLKGTLHASKPTFNKMLNDYVIEVKYLVAEDNSKLLRERRALILPYFDIFKSNVEFGIESLTNERKNEIIAWYKAVLELEEEAIRNVPYEVAKYMKKGGRL